MKRGARVFVFLRPLFSLGVGKTPRGEVGRWGITSRMIVTGVAIRGVRGKWGPSENQKAPPVKAGPSAYSLCYCIPHETQQANLALGPSPIRGYTYD
jgi:hypothetical protein